MTFNNDQRIAGLLALAGNWQDGSSQPVQLYDDDATHDYIVRVGFAGRANQFYASSMTGAIDKAIEGTPHAMVAASAAVPRAYPATLSPALAEILGQPCFAFIQFAQLWREGGVEINTSAEVEQAYFIDKHLRLYMQHGDKWRVAFGVELAAMLDKVKAERAQKEGGANG